jgi:S-formylglutathione hydrolase FrmB
MAHGEKWYTFLNEEFMPMVRGMFARLSPRRADNYLLGLSMGGYGAFKWALNEPGTFAAAGACASPLDIKLVMHRLERGLHPGGHDLFDAFGSEARVAGTQDDVMDVLKKQLAAGVPLPKLFQLCGTDDFGWEENTLARDKMQAMGAPLTMVSGPGGHNEMFWDQYLTQFLDWLPKEVD